MFKALTSSVREAVEWNYKEIKVFFTSQDMKRKFKCREAPIALPYISSTLLVNFKTCLGHQRQVASYFQCKVPSLDRYLNGSNPTSPMEN